MMGVLAGALLLIMCGGCSQDAGTPTMTATTITTPATPRTITVFGTFDLDGANSTSTGHPAIGVECFGLNGYSNLHAGTPITVTDASGTTVGLGELPAGEFTAVGDTSRECQFRFIIRNVPPGRNFYTLAIAGHTKQFAEADITKPLTLSVGS